MLFVGGDFEQVTDLADGETKIPAAANEAESTHMIPAVGSVIAAGARRFGKEPFLFVVANRYHLDAGGIRKFADRKASLRFLHLTL